MTKIEFIAATARLLGYRVDNYFKDGDAAWWGPSIIAPDGTRVGTPEPLMVNPKTKRITDIGYTYIANHIRNTRGIHLLKQWEAYEKAEDRKKRNKEKRRRKTSK